MFREGQIRELAGDVGHPLLSSWPYLQHNHGSIIRIQGKTIARQISFVFFSWWENVNVTVTVTVMYAGLDLKGARVIKPPLLLQN
jgi:hypothetical protein